MLWIKKQKLVFMNVDKNGKYDVETGTIFDITDQKWAVDVKVLEQLVDGGYLISIAEFRDIRINEILE